MSLAFSGYRLIWCSTWHPRSSAYLLFQFQHITTGAGLSNGRLHLVSHAFGGCLWFVQRYQEPAFPCPVFAKSLVRNKCQPDRQRVILQATFTNGTLDNTFTITNNLIDAVYGIGNRSNIAEFYAWGLSPLSLSNLESRLAVDTETTSLESLDDYMIAYSCSLYFCIQAYNVSTTAGVTSQTIVGTWP